MRSYTFLIRPARSRIGLALIMVLIFVLGAWLDAKADESLPSSTPDFPSIIRAHSDPLAKVESDKGAMNLFVSAIGPALQLGDVARILRAYPLSAKLATELLVPDLTAAVLRLMSSLSVWHLADTVIQTARDQQLSMVTERLSRSPQARAWLDQHANAAWHDSVNQLFNVVAAPGWVTRTREASASPVLVRAFERPSVPMGSGPAIERSWFAGDMHELPRRHIRRLLTTGIEQ